MTQVHSALIFTFDRFGHHY